MSDFEEFSRRVNRAAWAGAGVFVFVAATLFTIFGEEQGVQIFLASLVANALVQVIMLTNKGEGKER